MNTKQQTHAIADTALTAADQSTLELVVPFTTPDLTRAAVTAACQMATDLGATLRVIRVQCVPYPLDINQSPVFVEFLRQQMESFQSNLPLTSEIRFTREYASGLGGALKENSVVVLSYRKRPWRTRNERLAALLQKSGRKVILLSQESDHA